MRDSISKLLTKHKREFLLVGLGVLVVAIAVVIWLGMRGMVYLPVQIDIGDKISIRTYSITILLAVATGVFVYNKLRKGDKTLEKLDLWEGLMIVLVVGVIGARAYHVATDWYIYQNSPVLMLALWNGGLGIIGGVVGGIVGMYFYAKYRKLSFENLLAPAIVAMPVAQAVGRLGNLFNRELYGLPTALPWGQYIEPAFRFPLFAQFDHYHPLFLYEMIGLLVLFGLLLVAWKRVKKSEYRAFHLLKIYVAGYGVLRFCLDFLRVEGNSGVWYFTFAQWVILLILLGVLVFGVAYQVWHRLEYGKWFTRLPR